MKKAHIVVIEDNPADVYLIRKALDETGIEHSVRQFPSGVDAVGVLCSANATEEVPDMILMDLNTPRTDGFEALRTLKETPRLSGVPIAILTSSTAQRDRQRAQREGTRYIEKPSRLYEFLSTVGQAAKEMLGSRAA